MEYNNNQIKEIFPEFEKPSLSIDLVILSVANEDLVNKDPRLNPKKLLKVLLIRKKDSDEDWRLPGSFMRIEESSKDTINRILETKIGLNTSNLSDVYTEQLYTEADKLDRDTRGRVVTIIYTCIVPESSVLSSLENLEETEFEVSWHIIKDKDVHSYNNNEVKESVQLDFDHKDIINDSINRIKNKINYTDIIFKFLNEKFTFSDFENTYLSLSGTTSINLRRFTKDWMVQTEEIVNTGHHRPCKLFVQNKEYKF